MLITYVVPRMTIYMHVLHHSGNEIRDPSLTTNDASTPHLKFSALDKAVDGPSCVIDR